MKMLKSAVLVRNPKERKSLQVIFILTGFTVNVFPESNINEEVDPIVTYSCNTAMYPWHP